MQVQVLYSAPALVPAALGLGDPVDLGLRGGFKQAAALRAPLGVDGRRAGGTITASSTIYDVISGPAYWYFSLPLDLASKMRGHTY